jgi:hypothetical protein
MPSPFPGMDPYLESPTHWSDFHSRFINALADALNERLPEDFVARIGEHILSIAPTFRDEGDSPEFIPDVTVISGTDRPDTGQGAVSTASGAGVLTPTKVRNVKFADDYIEAYLEVQRLPAMQVVTVIELLSPTNKYGEGRGIYMRKRRELLAQQVNLVEFDLIRAGGRIEFSEPLPAGHYHAFVSPTDQRPITDVYSWSIRDPLPAIPVPLVAPLDPVRLDLAAPFAQAYQAGRYRKLIRYSAPPPAPSLSRPDAEWVRQITQE